MEIINFYKLKDVYKIVKLPIKVLDNNNKKQNRNENNTLKLFNNLIRAKTNISNKILCNDFKYFFTQTINNFYDREDIDTLRKIFNDKVRYLRKKYNLNLQYIIIAEKHKKGGYHFHGVLNGDFEQFIYINKNGYNSLSCFDVLGFNSIEEIRDIYKMSGYITKYITKDFADREKGQHLYFCSHGLKKPLLIHSHYNNGTKIDFDFENDYCSIKYCDKATAFNFILQFYSNY